METSDASSAPAETGPPTIPYARTTIALDAGHFADIRRAVALLFRVAHSESYRALVDAGVDPLRTHQPGNSA